MPNVTTMAITTIQPLPLPLPPDQVEVEIPSWRYGLLFIMFILYSFKMLHLLMPLAVADCHFAQDIKYILRIDCITYWTIFLNMSTRNKTSFDIAILHIWIPSLTSIEVYIVCSIWKI